MSDEAAIVMTILAAMFLIGYALTLAFLNDAFLYFRTAEEPIDLSAVYIAGPMSAFWEQAYNRAAFEREAEMLRKYGFTPIIPHELDAEDGIDLARPPQSFTRDEKAAMMRRDIAAIDRSVAVWTFQLEVPSFGRDAELAHAKFVGVPVFSDIEAMKAWRNGNAKAA